jgi:hypothetical protein
VNSPKRKLSNWVSRAPDNADSLRVISRAGFGGEQTLIQLGRSEIATGDGAAIAERIIEECEAWSDSEGRECLFTCQYFSDSENPVSTFRFRLGPVDGAGFQVDGSPESFLMQMQGTLLEKDKILIQVFKQQTDMWTGLLEKLLQRNIVLEQEKVNLEALKEELQESQMELVMTAGNDSKMSELMKTAQKLLEANINKAKTGD